MVTIKVSILETISTATYKGHKIDKVESPMQRFFVVDNDLAHAWWSMSDAKKSINGQVTTSESVNISTL